MGKLIFLFCASYRNNFLFLKDVAYQNPRFENKDLQVKLYFLLVQPFASPFSVISLSQVSPGFVLVFPFCCPYNAFVMPHLCPRLVPKSRENCVCCLCHDQNITQINSQNKVVIRRRKDFGERTYCPFCALINCKNGLAKHWVLTFKSLSISYQ